MTPGPRLHLWVLLLLIAAFVAVFGWWGNTRLRGTLEDTVHAELETTLGANVTALEIWITNQVRLVTALSDEPRLRELAIEQLQDEVEPTPEPAAPPRRPREPREVSDLDRYLQQRLTPLQNEGILVGTNMAVVATSGRGRMRRTGLPVMTEHQDRFAEMFATGQPVMITPFRPRRPQRMRSFPQGPRRESPPRFQGIQGGWADRPAEAGGGMVMLVAAPVRDDLGVIRGGLALIIDPEKEFSRILSVARSGSSGETYAFDASGLMISRSRFDTQLKALGLLEDRPDVTSALTLPLVDPGGDLTRGFQNVDTATNRPLVQSIAEATAGRDGIEVVPSRDYRGVPVVAAWHWLPDHNFGVATQIDAREAYQALRMLRLLFFTLFLLLVLSANGFFLASYFGAAWRRRLSEAEHKAKRLGQYELEEKIGEGGMGVVYRGRHALLRRDTAIKLLLPDRADHAAIQRFEREVQLTCRLTHPNTIQVYDYGHTPDGTFYYAMEFLQGLNLKDLVLRFGSQPEGRVIHILCQVADALHEAHQHGLVHRDIKPANVFLSDRGGVPDAVKVLDFGLVREFRSSQARSSATDSDSTPMGTPLFMSPESILSPGRSDPRTDIYSLGALGYYLVTAQPVFDGDTTEAITQSHLHALPIAPSQRGASHVSPALDAALLRCLEKDPSKRPASAPELKQLLLQSPHARSWDEEHRAAWWENHRAEVQALHSPSHDPEVSASRAHLEIDRTLRTLAKH